MGVSRWGSVLKLKKPVRFPFLDFGPLAKRLLACWTEVDLNRRLARDVHLGAVPLCMFLNGLAIGEGIAAVDWLVKMRRLDEGRMLDSLITKRQVDRHLLTRSCLSFSTLTGMPIPSFCGLRSCYRAMLRARLSIAHLLAQRPRTPEKWRPEALAYLRIAALDARQLEKALRILEDRKAVSPRSEGVWLQLEAAHMSGLPPYHAWSPASRGTAERCRW